MEWIPFFLTTQRISSRVGMKPFWEVKKILSSGKWSIFIFPNTTRGTLGRKGQVCRPLGELVWRHGDIIMWAARTSSKKLQQDLTDFPTWRFSQRTWLVLSTLGDFHTNTETPWQLRYMSCTSERVLNKIFIISKGKKVHSSFGSTRSQQTIYVSIGSFQKLKCHCVLYLKYNGIKEGCSMW